MMSERAGLTPKQAKKALKRMAEPLTRFPEGQTAQFDLGRGIVTCTLERRSGVLCLTVRTWTGSLIVLPDSREQIGVLISPGLDRQGAP